MAVTGGFFVSKEHDRKYSTSQVNGFFKGLIGNGVFKNVGGGLQVIAGDGMQVLVKPGKLTDSKGRWLENDTTLSLTVESSHVVLNRWDAVIARIDSSVAVRSCEITIKKGTTASIPPKPSITRNDAVEEYVLAYIEVKAGTATIKPYNIVDTRLDSRVCGYVTGLIEQLNTSDLFVQWTDAFDTWFNGIKNSLKWSYLVNSYNSTYTTTDNNETQILIDIEGFNKEIDILNVYINGLRLIPGIEYIINSNDMITLAQPVLANTLVAFEVIKCQEDPNTSAIESLIKLQRQVDRINSEIYTTKTVTEHKNVTILQRTENIDVSNINTFKLTDDGGLAQRTFYLTVYQYDTENVQIGTNRVEVGQELDISAAKYIVLLAGGSSGTFMIEYELTGPVSVIEELLNKENDTV